MKEAICQGQPRRQLCKPADVFEACVCLFANASCCFTVAHVLFGWVGERDFGVGVLDLGPGNTSNRLKMEPIFVTTSELD